MWKSYKTIRRVLSNAKQRAIYLSNRVSNPKAVYWVFTPEHGNLGDHAIAQAEKALFNAWGIKTIELTGAELAHMKRRNILGIMNGRTILVNGGGILGTLWFDAELLFREIIKKTPRSQIIVLPNTIYYEKDDWGNAELEKSVSIYNAHPKLTICSRERTTFELAVKLYKDVKLIPDMVMSMNYCESTSERAGCLLCLRSDREKTRSEGDDAKILIQVKELFEDRFRYRDMCVDHAIPINQRDAELQQQYEAFQGAELVITDRLHGMIFSAITGTPCIVIDSKSPKVRGCYEWIRHLDYIRFCNDVNDISELYRSMPKGSQKYDNSSLMPYYDELKEVIMAAVKKR